MQRSAVVFNQILSLLLSISHKFLWSHTQLNHPLPCLSCPPYFISTADSNNRDLIIKRNVQFAFHKVCARIFATFEANSDVALPLFIDESAQEVCSACAVFEWENGVCMYVFVSLFVCLTKWGARVCVCVFLWRIKSVCGECMCVGGCYIG